MDVSTGEDINFIFGVWEICPIVGLVDAYARFSGLTSELAGYWRLVLHIWKGYDILLRCMHIALNLSQKECAELSYPKSYWKSG